VSHCSTVVGVTTAVSPVVVPLLVSVAVVGAGDRVEAGVGIGAGAAVVGPGVGGVLTRRAFATRSSRSGVVVVS